MSKLFFKFWEHGASLWNWNTIFCLKYILLFLQLHRAGWQLLKLIQGNAHFVFSGLPMFNTEEVFHKCLVNWTDCSGAKEHSVWIAETFHFLSPLTSQGESTTFASRIFRYDCQLFTEKTGCRNKKPKTHTSSQLQKRNSGVHATEHDWQGKHPFLNLNKVQGLRQMKCTALRHWPRCFRTPPFP